MTVRRPIAGSSRTGNQLLKSLSQVLAAGPATGSRATASLLVRLAAGTVFVVFGAGKLTSHASEVASFRTYGLPSPDAFVYAIGMVEVLGGALLIAGFATRLAALVLAGDMVGAIIVSGIGQGELISFTLAPTQLAAMLFLLWTGPGRRALDRRHSTRPPPHGSDQGPDACRRPANDRPADRQER